MVATDNPKRVEGRTTGTYRAKEVVSRLKYDRRRATYHVLLFVSNSVS